MAKFEDTPAWKKRQVWDPVKQKMVSPPTKPTVKQRRLILHLAAEMGIEALEPTSNKEASRMINRLRDLKLRRLGV